MSASTISLCYGFEGNVETVLLDENMHFFRRMQPPPCPDKPCMDIRVLGEVAEYPLLEYQLNKQRSKPRRESTLFQPLFRRERSCQNLTRSSKDKSSFSPTKEVAMAWMQMGSQRGLPVEKPFRNSSIHNRVQDSSLASQNRSFKKPKSLRSFNVSSRLPVATVDSCRNATRPTDRHSERFRSVPAPPPIVSHRRRFRVCFGVMTDWKSAVDPKSGRPYYYNEKTRETQWRKPMELASDAERVEMEEKEKKQKDFFAIMEANILKSMATGQVVVNSPKPEMMMKKKPSLQPVRPRSLVRTISTMDEGILKDLVKRTPSFVSRERPSTAVRNSTLERIAEASRDLEQSSSLDFESSSSLFDESVMNLGMSMADVQALRDLAQLSEEMTKGSNDEDMDISMADGLEMSTTEFTVSLSDGLDFGFSSNKKNTRSVPSMDGLLFSPEVENTKKLTAPKRESITSDIVFSKEADFDKSVKFGDSFVFSPELSFESKKTVPAPGDIVFTPDVIEDTKVPAEVLLGNEADVAAEPDLRSGLKGKPKLVKRNTCGTLYVGTTMSAPDKDANIKCICGVYRAHILASEEEDQQFGYSSTRDKFKLFNDRESQRKSIISVSEEGESLDNLQLDEMEKSVPSLEAITAFYRDVFTRAQMETDCIIMSLIYVERLIKVTEGLLRPRRSNWRSLLFSCMIMASKVWDDLSMWNGDFSQTCPAGVQFKVKRINELELAILKALKYKVKVPASEYAKYYFLLRSMLIKSGLGSDELKTGNPLDVEGAKRLEQLSSNFQNVAATKRKMAQDAQLRSKSMGSADKSQLIRAQQRGGASLEHLVKM